jgi:5-methylcytosine-specific restriction endonuclease McrA
MSEAAAKYMKAKADLHSVRAEPREGSHEKPPNKEHNSPEDLKVIASIQREARRKGATLSNGGKGGLEPKLARSVFRRDKYRCVCNADHGGHDGVCGTKEELGLHHLGGIAKTDELSEMGHENAAENIITICEDCHDALHENARERGDDSSQVTPKGDVGTYRDHGKPVADPTQ